MADNNVQPLKSPALPATAEELLERKTLKTKKTINDHVDDIVVRMWPDEAFQRWNEAIYDSQAVEGAMDIDDVFAAMMIREFAKKENYPTVANAKLDTVVRAMHVALRRYKLTRATRRGDAEAA